MVAVARPISGKTLAVLDGCERSIPIAAWRARHAGTGVVATQCIIIQITTLITPKDPTKVEVTKQRSKKSI
jgi:hypothetical protein